MLGRLEPRDLLRNDTVIPRFLEAGEPDRVVE